MVPSPLDLLRVAGAAQSILWHVRNLPTFNGSHAMADPEFGSFAVNQATTEFQVAAQNVIACRYIPILTAERELTARLLTDSRAKWSSCWSDAAFLALVDLIVALRKLRLQQVDAAYLDTRIEHAAQCAARLSRLAAVVSLDPPQITLSDGNTFALKDNEAFWLRELLKTPGEWMSRSQFIKRCADVSDAVRPDQFDLPDAIQARLETNKRMGTRWKV